MPWTKEALETELGVKLASIKWTTILTHEGVHFDEILTCIILRRYGADMFPGIRETKINFAFHAELGQQAWRTLMREGIIPVGVLDSPFDEHSPNRNGSEKLQCAASLVWEFLGVPASSPLHELVEYARLVDTTVGVDFHAETGAPFFWHWADMVKDARTNKVAPDEVYFDRFGNIIMAEGEMRRPDIRLSRDPLPKNDVPSLSELLAYWADQNHVDTSSRIMKKLAEYGEFFAANPTCLRSDKFGFHPAALLYRMQRCPNLNPATRREVLAAIQFCFQQAVMAQTRFDVALATFDQAITQALTVRGVKLLCLSHTNPDLQKALRYRKCQGVLVQHNPDTGELAVFWHTGKVFPSEQFIAAIRREELKERGERETVPEDRLTAQGEIAGWYRHNGGNFLLWRNAEASRLDRESFTAIFSRLLRR